MKRVAVFVVVCLVLLSFTCFSYADEDWHEFQLDMQSTDWSSTIDLPKFNSTLGTLDYVYFFFDSNFLTTVYYENESPDPITAEADIRWSVRMEGPGIWLGSSEGSPSVYDTRDLAGYDGQTDYSGDSGWTSDLLSDYISYEAFVFSDIDDLSPFIGSGTVPLSVSATVSPYFGGTDLYNAYADSQADAYVGVIYGYSPVPEPAGLLALVVGTTSLVGLVVKSKQRR